MVETITPVVHGGSRTRWGAAVVLHAVAATVVAAIFGALLGAAGALLGAPWDGGWWVVLFALGLAAAAHELLGTPFRVPQLRRQVPDWWRTFFSPFPAAALYGAALGVGFLTYVTHATLVVVAAAAASSGDPLLGAAVMAPFGLARGASAVASAGEPGPLLVERLAAFARGRTLPIANGLALVPVAVAAALTRPERPVALAPMAGAALAVAFAWSAGWKAVRPRRWRTVLGGYGLGALQLGLARSVPAFEALVPLGVLVGRPAAAAGVALGLLALGSAAVVRARIRSGDRRLACGCFGAEASDYRLILARNVGLALLAAAGLGAPPGDGLPLAWPARADLLPAALALVGAATLAWIFLSVLRSLREARA